RRVAEVVARLNKLLAAAAALVVRDDRGELRPQGDGFAHVLGTVVLRGFRVGCTDHTDGGAHNVHGVGGDGQKVDGVLDVVVEVTLFALHFLQLFELQRGGEFAVPQQVGDFFEGAVGGEFLHGVAAVQ